MEAQTFQSLKVLMGLKQTPWPTYWNLGRSSNGVELQTPSETGPRLL